MLFLKPFYMKISREDAKAYLDRHGDLLREMLDYKSKASAPTPGDEADDAEDLIKVYHTLKTYELEKPLPYISTFIYIMQSGIKPVRRFLGSRPTLLPGR
jgi:hypothetical protein